MKYCKICGHVLTTCHTNPRNGKKVIYFEGCKNCKTCAIAPKRTINAE